MRANKVACRHFVLALAALLLLQYDDITGMSNGLPILAEGRLLLIVGDVDTANARILHEWLPDDTDLAPSDTVFVEAKGYHLNVAPNVERERLIHAEQFSSKRVPQILKLSSLSSGSFYRIDFLWRTSAAAAAKNEGSSAKESVTFRTVPEFPSVSASLPDPEPLRLLVLSCDRYSQDRDDEFWEVLWKRERKRFGILFNGDVVYADNIRWNWPNGSAKSFDTLLNEFREIYKLSFGRPLMQKILRHGSNLMIPDDHDIINNLNPQRYANPNLTTLIDAGLRAFAEYQFQLHTDIPKDFLAAPASKLESRQGLKQVLKQIYRFKRFYDVGIAILDTRYQRTFNFEPDAALFGSQQLSDVDNHLEKEWKGDTINHLVIVTGVPLLLEVPSLAAIPAAVEQEYGATHSENMQDTLGLLERFKLYIKETGKSLLLMAGDSHIFVHTSACSGPANEEFCLTSVITSGMTKGSTSVSAPHVFLFRLLSIWYTGEGIGPWRLDVKQVYLGRNYAYVDIHPGSSARTNQTLVRWGMVQGDIAHPLGKLGQAIAEQLWIGRILWPTIQLFALCVTVYLFIARYRKITRQQKGVDRSIKKKS